VTDTGIGIPEEALEHIFEEFSSGGQQYHREYGGTGLDGNQSAVRPPHGGDITVQSTVGVGSTLP